jgi:cytochrome o ubiquinol oxidase subunit 2
MHFEVRVVPAAEFSTWATTASQSGTALDAARYAQLAQQDTKVTTATFRLDQPDLFQSVVMQTIPPAAGPPISQPKASVSPRSGGGDAVR